MPLGDQQRARPLPPLDLSREFSEQRSAASHHGDLNTFGC
jgi:hypothetical protein